MKSKNIIYIVSHSRKAQAIKNCLESDISPDYSASILRNHESVFFFLDKDSDKLLEKKNLGYNLL